MILASLSRTLVLLGIAATCALQAAPLSVARMFGDNMVLQRNRPVAVWGAAAPGAVVTVSIQKKSARGTADANGHWAVTLPPLSAGLGYSMIVRSTTNEKLRYRNVAIGDVFFAGGQSNMQFTMKQALNGERDAAQARHHDIRLFSVGHAVSYRPQTDFPAPLSAESEANQWHECRPDTVLDFSAVAYYFASTLAREERVPIGIVNVSWGGTPIEAHMSLEANRGLPFHRERVSEIEAKPATEELRFDPAKATPQEPASVFNAMIAPVIPYTIAGCLWYQGEHNWNHPYRYREQLVTFIGDLRSRWGNSALPFYVVQLPNTGKTPVEPDIDFWSVLRESQMAALTLPHTGVVVTLDLGDGDLHPRDKRPVGERLARFAQRDLYGRSVAAEGPRLASARPVGNALELHFDPNGSGLAARGGALNGFAVAGEDRKFRWAEAKIVGNAVVLTAAGVDRPIAARYGWGENPTATLMNREGLPAYPFRTDDWPLKADGTW